PPDLLVQFRCRALLLNPRALRASSSVEHSLGTLQQLPLPLMDLRRVNPVQRRQLTCRLHFPHCRQCHLRLERRPMNLPCPGHHDLSFVVMVFYLNHWSRFWGPPYMVVCNATDWVTLPSNPPLDRPPIPPEMGGPRRSCSPAPGRVESGHGRISIEQWTVWELAGEYREASLLAFIRRADDGRI